MQLRVARLCLDCEELHVADTCPICASERYAFLSTWLPSEERRRWRRSTTRGPLSAPRPIDAVRRLVARVFGARGDQHDGYQGPRTRASDLVPQMNFEGQGDASHKQPAQTAAPRPLPHDR